MAKSPEEKRSVHFSGRVQGVGFRATTQQIASQFAVAGYVRNLENGQVELVAEGTAYELNRFLTELRQTMAQNIQTEKSDTLPATGTFRSFAIRY